MEFSLSASSSSQPLPPPPFLYGAAISALIYIIARSLSHRTTTVLCTKSFQEKVANLTFEQLYHYHSLLPSTIHAVIQIIGTYYCVFYGDKDAVVFDDEMFVSYGITGIGPSFYMGFFVGYLITDVIFAPSLKILGYPFVVHHISAAMCWTYCASNRIMQPLASFLQFNELSTILMNLRQVLLTAGYTSSDPIVTIVSLLFFAMFAAVRVFPLPFVVHQWIVRDFVSIRNEVGLGGAVLLSLFLAVNVMLQGSWFSMMVRKLIGMITKKPKRKEH